MFMSFKDLNTLVLCTSKTNVDRDKTIKLNNKRLSLLYGSEKNKTCHYDYSVINYNNSILLAGLNITHASKII